MWNGSRKEQLWVFFNVISFSIKGGSNSLILFDIFHLLKKAKACVAMQINVLSKPGEVWVEDERKLASDQDYSGNRDSTKALNGSQTSELQQEV